MSRKWIDPHSSDWAAVWDYFVQHYGPIWDEEFGPEWDVEMLEAEYYEMYLAAREWGQLWDQIWAKAWGMDGDDWDQGGEEDWYADHYNFISPGEMTVFTRIFDGRSLC